ncbi:54S ribosomal protein L3 [Datura stramonium]|uniref:54S ribosomal protein L3 n=1 Tax=Datura stramonium TaxID=4076 RepID=A0ABS8WWM5_DATST|nr:54S ribosomal protein L3 [Datura stramonium]
MPGCMGGVQRTVKNVWVYKIDPARNLMWVKGQSAVIWQLGRFTLPSWNCEFGRRRDLDLLHGTVPGAEGNFVFIKDSVYKKPDISMLPFPTYFAQEDEDVADLEPLMADLGDTDPFMAAD